MNFAVGQHRLLRGRIAVGQQHLGARPGRHRQPGADRHRIAKARRRFQRGHADPRRALAAVELHALAGDLAQPRQHHRAGGQQRIVDLPGQFGRARDRAASGPRRRGPAAGALPGPRPAGARWRAAGRCARTVRPARTASRRPCAAHPPLCPARRCRYPVSQGDTSVPDCEIVKHDHCRHMLLIDVRGETPRTMAEKVWDDHVVAHGAGEGAAREPDLIYIDLHLVHEVTSPQAFDGLRLAGRPVRRPDLTHRHRGSQRADDRHRQADRRPGLAHPGRDAAPQLRRVRHPAAPDGRRRTGHRARHRAATGSDPARHDGRVRRQPHLHPRRVRRARDGHRHIGGRARARHADAAAAAVQDDGGQRRRPAARRVSAPRTSSSR